MENVFTIKQKEFEGPMDLLLDLIEKKKFHINDVSLAEVADSFLEYIKRLSSFPTEEAANFIAIASTLILIKSVSLLPTLTISEEESEDIEELQERLRILKDIKERGVYIKEMFGKNIIFMAEDKKNIQPVFSPTSEVTVSNFLASIKNIIASIPKKDILPEAVIKKVMSLEDAIDNLVLRIGKDLKMSFFKINSKHDKINLIVSFLAVLELCKRGAITIRQEAHFCDIDIESGAHKVPIYS